MPPALASHLGREPLRREQGVEEAGTKVDKQKHAEVEKVATGMDVTIQQLKQLSITRAISRAAGDKRW